MSGELALIIVGGCLVGFVVLILLPAKKTEKTTPKKGKQQPEHELYTKIGGKYYKLSEVEEEKKKPEKKEHIPWAWR